MSTRQQHLFTPNCRSWSTEILRKNRLPGLWIIVESVSKRSGLVSHYFSPLKLHPPCRHSPPGPQHPAEVPGRLHLRKKARTGDPTMRRSRSEVNFPWSWRSEDWATVFWVPWGLCSQPSKPDSTGLWVLYHQHPARGLCPIQSSMGTHACSGSREGITAHVREVGGNKWAFLFLLLLFFNLHFYASVSVQPPDSTMTHTNSLSLLWGILLP